MLARASAVGRAAALRLPTSPIGALHLAAPVVMRRPASSSTSSVFAAVRRSTHPLPAVLQQPSRSCSTQVPAAGADDGLEGDELEAELDEADELDELEAELDDVEDEPLPDPHFVTTSDMRPPKDTSRKWVTLDPLGRAFAVGRRKKAIARVRVWPVEDKDQATVRLNKMSLSSFFGGYWEQRLMVLAPFLETGTAGQYAGRASVKGGGITGQAQAVRGGIATALQGLDARLRPKMKAAGYLKRDPRQRERKKPGRRGARAKFAWVKR